VPKALSLAALLGLLFVLVASPLAFGAVHPISYATFQTAIFGLVFVAAAGWVFEGERERFWSFRTPCLLAACFGLLIAVQLLPMPRGLLKLVSPHTLSTVEGSLFWRPEVRATALSLYPLGTELSALQYLACFGVFLLTVGLCDSRGKRLGVAWALTCAGTVIALLGLRQHWLSPGRIYGFWQSVYGGAYFGPFVNRNHFAGYLEMILPIAAALAFVRRAPWASADSATPGRDSRVSWHQVAALGCAVVMLTAIVVSLSRGGIIAAAAASCVMAVVAWRASGSRRTAIACIAILVAGFATGLFYAGPELIGRWRALMADIRDPMGTSRTVATLRTLDLVAHYPLFGTGLGSFRAVFTSVQTPELGLGLYRYAHNDWVQLAAEMGMAGLVVTIWLIVYLIRQARRRLKEGGVRSSWWLTLGCAASLTAVGVHSLVDFNLHIPSNAFLCTAVAGLLCAASVSLSTGRLKRPSLTGSRPAMAAACLVCVGLGMAACVCTVVCRYRCSAELRGFSPSFSGDVARLERANRLCERDPQPFFLLSQLHTGLAKQEPGEAKRAHCAAAVASGRLAVELNPTSALYHEHLGWLHFLACGSPTADDLAWAERHLKRAAELDPAYPEWALSLGRFYLMTGRFAEADRWFAEAISLNPAAIPDTIDELVAAGTSIRRVRELLPRTPSAQITLGDYVYKKGQKGEAKLSFDLACKLATEPRIRTRAAVKLARSGGTVEARAHSESWLKADPGQIDYLRALAQVAALAGDLDLRISCLEKALAQDPDNMADLSSLAACRQAKGEWQEALELLRRALRVEPLHSGPADGVVNCLLRMGRDEEALDEARAFLRRTPFSAAAHFRLASVLFGQDRIVEALEHYREACRLAPENKSYDKALERAVLSLYELERIQSD